MAGRGGPGARTGALWPAPPPVPGGNLSGFPVLIWLAAFVAQATANPASRRVPPYTGGMPSLIVEMGSDQEAQAAIAALNGKVVGGRSLTVNEAKPREDRGGGRGGRDRS